ncbi:MAG TPA: NAD(P)-dependent oxidoreductase [Bryobacteraceae bacterium]|jgi:3-hydroxyisobutyrate dehydrogenase-like beta-hydroxyacid dehydrogenase|nr:NAD(P)-dependent oxidoreductase [Bryobacteraceae bacterium]
MLTDQRIVPNSRLGFIGLGHLGSPIARRLVASFPMVVYDRDRAKAEELRALGATVADDPRSLAADADVVLSCLPDGAAVEDLYLGSGNVLRSARPHGRIIELSTIAPETSRMLHGAARGYGISMLDVAISGSSPAAEAGKLTLFGGGERGEFESSEPIFSRIAHQWFYMGPSGSGVAMKLVVNTLLGLGMQAIAEALALGSLLDLPRDLLYSTLAKTAVVPPALTGKLTAAERHDFTPQFPLRLMRKDFGLIVAAAEKSGLFMPATESAAAVNAAEAASGRDEDFSAVIRLMEQRYALETIAST